MIRRETYKEPGWPRQALAVGVALTLLLFLLPFLFLPEEGEKPPETPVPTATLPVLEPASVESVPGWDEGQSLRLLQADGSVAEITLADYLWGVVAAEMPASFEPEALKAQAVTARTYTLYQMSIGRNPNHPDADMCADITCCQAYIDPAKAAENWGEAAAGYSAKITGAISATDGQAILYQGAPIDAVFFSSAAGRTLDSVEVWGGSVPYLASVESPEGDEVPGYRSTVTVSAADFRETFSAKYPEADLSGDPSGWFQNTVPTSSGGVETVEVGGVVVKGTALRSLFGLRSATFTASAEDGAVVFHVTGYGHGVGMSQYGANAMAKEGKDYQEILTHYYTGVTVEPWQAG